MASVYIVHCKDGRPCRHPLDEGLWTNLAFDLETANNDLKRLDKPADSENARFLRRNDPQAFARWSAGVKGAKCGPHRVIEYRAVQ